MQIELVACVGAFLWIHWIANGWLMYQEKINDTYSKIDRSNGRWICDNLATCTLPPIDYGNSHGIDAVCLLQNLAAEQGLGAPAIEGEDLCD
jgi:hypothetical protein